MSFNPINPGMIQQPMIQRTQVRMVQGGSLLDKPTTGERFMLGLKKFGAVFSRVAASVLKFFPGLGTVASAGLYGISNLAEWSYNKQVGERVNSLMQDEAHAGANYQFLTPGFGMFGSPNGVGTQDINDGFGPQKLNTVLSREMAARYNINQLGAGAFS